MHNSVTINFSSALKSQKVLFRKIVVVFLVVVSCFVFLSKGAQAIQLPENEMDTVKTEIYASLEKKAQQKGKVRVIVQLRAEDLNESSVAKAQSDMISLSPKIEGALIKNFALFPLSTLEVDLETLKLLEESNVIESIQEDIPEAPSLLQSTLLIDADDIWTQSVEGNGQVIAILDTGVDSSHSFLASKVVEEACFSTTSILNDSESVCPGGVDDSTAPGSAQPPFGVDGADHGTHVAGIASGRNGTFMGSNFDGVARGADIVAIQVFSKFNSPSDCRGFAPCLLSFPSDQIQGLERVLQLRTSGLPIASVNMSLGGSPPRNCDSDARKSEVDDLLSFGVVTVAASGNAGNKGQIDIPACISSVLSVGSTNILDRVSSFSNSSNKIDLLAPGESIISSVPGGGFASLNGTSMATPHVAGAIAALESGSSAPIATIVAALTNNGVAVRDNSNNVVRPRIDLDDSLAALNRTSSP